MAGGGDVIIDLEHPEYWIQLARLRTTPAQWHAYNWRGSFLYRSLVLEVAGRLWDPVPDFCWQAEPNLRIHPPKGPGIEEHTDGDFGHLAEEWNCWVPLTELTDDSQRLWVKGDIWAPVDCQPGQAYLFRGATTEHASVSNNTQTTRRSMDFRLIRAAAYEDRGIKTIEYGVPMRIPEYWSRWTDV